LREAGKRRGMRLEGATKVDAVLLAPDTGFAVLFEAKVLADVSGGVEFDVLRNQIARNIDVMLEPNPRVMCPLNQRNPDRSCFVLLTPEREQRWVAVGALDVDRYHTLWPHGCDQPLQVGDSGVSGGVVDYQPGTPAIRPGHRTGGRAQARRCATASGRPQPSAQLGAR